MITEFCDAGPALPRKLRDDSVKHFLCGFLLFSHKGNRDQSGINGKPVSPLTTGRYDLLLKLMHDKDLHMEAESEDVEGDRGRFH